MFMSILFVAVGGAIGSVMRYGVGLAVTAPLGTLAVNVAGSFAIGLLWVALNARGAQALMPLLMTGLLGGFTTFSAFSFDTMRLIETGRVGVAMAYVFASVTLSLLACFAAMSLARGWST